jgi:hypothetical protein
MGVRTARLGFVGAALSLAFWVITPLAMSNSYIHGQEGVDAVLVALSFGALVGAFLVRQHPGWAALLFALAVVPGLGAALLPGVLLAIATLTALQPADAGAEAPARRSAPLPWKFVRDRAVAARPVAVPVSAQPHATDMPLPSRRGEVVIYRASDGAEVDRCQGPDYMGGCPRPQAGGVVPCAGCLLALPVVVRGSRGWHIPAAYQTCILGGYDIYRQPVTAATP